MGSVFTYDPDPPRVSSPWLLPLEPGRQGPVDASEPESPQCRLGLASECLAKAKLMAEPQDGPTEYKLHLLLRPRRTYSSMSTVTVTPGSQHSKSSPELRTKIAPPVLSSSSQARQTRLQHLTTQLLWRLQQSSPFHASTFNKDLVLPQLPDDGINPLLHVPTKPGKLLPGLEESRGALYEIGVSDDGTLVGLTREETDESVATLRVMAASLGCTVEILRAVIVGDCEWTEPDPGSQPVVQKANLWVTEALVVPVLGTRDEGSPDVGSPEAPHIAAATRAKEPERNRSTTAQLRITLTGPTTSGKSTLLGTLSTGLLDNGRGKSRLNLLRHRHEVASGITSSVAQELVGYKDKDIFNYTHGIIESWVEIHDRSDGGRLVFVSDSAGHPRYRRTVLRGLVGWDPHWTVLCIAADDADMSSGAEGFASTARDMLSIASEGIDLAQAHLDLCLRLETPLAIVITKLDLGNRQVLTQTMNKVLTSIKQAGRTPKIIQPDQTPRPNLTRIPESDYAKVAAVTDSMGGYEEAWSCVPIVLTSAVNGRGIGLIHALFQSLPMPPIPTSRDFIGMALNPEQPQTLFHIDDTFSLPVPFAHVPSAAGPGDSGSAVDKGVVVAGYLRFGSFTVGDRVLVGPFPSEEDGVPRTPPGGDDRNGGTGYGLSVSHPLSAELARIAMHNAVSASTIKGEWHGARIISIHNLRLPVLSLDAGQAGSIGIAPDWPEQQRARDESADAAQTNIRNNHAPHRIRRGMVIAIPSRHMSDTGLSLQASSGFTASFKDPDAESLIVGSLVNTYVANVRAAARILRVWPSSRSSSPDPSSTATEDIGVFSLAEHHADDDDDDDKDDEDDYGDEDDGAGGRLAKVKKKRKKGGAADGGGVDCPLVEVSFELLTNREWIEMGSRVTVLEGGRRDKSGLEGYVGRVVEIVD